MQKMSSDAEFTIVRATYTKRTTIYCEGAGLQVKDTAEYHLHIRSISTSPFLFEDTQAISRLRV